VIVDPCATASGVAAAPPADLAALRRICDEHGILLICDEVITGFCRTGTMFAAEQSGVTPDLMTLSKALSSGYMPIGATVVAAKVTETLTHAQGRDAVFAHGHTYGGHPVACAVALENIAILHEEGLADAASERGRHLRAGLGSLAGHGTFADARGIGMLNGLELLPGGDADAGRFGTAVAACVWLRKRLRDLGLVTLTVHPGRVFLLAPPLIATESELDRIVEILDQGLTDLEAAR
jgi:adenosylmethionine-8-amino-7-oxononanoate aminotransferase